ncbi:MAG TPA: aldolase/citrate lyase family protein [Alphaproteobacteria bacterium]
MQRSNLLRRRLLEGRKAFGLWLHTAHPAVTEAMAAAGYDFLFLDNEHGPGSLNDTLIQLQILASGTTSPVVRVPSNDPVYLKRVLDIGASSIMIPMIETAEQAKAAVAACRYPPHGSRGFGPWREIGLGTDLDAYGRTAHEDLLIIGQIETVTAVENIDAIAAVDGLDVLFIGPNDLSGSAGRFREFEHPDVTKLIGRAFDGIRRAGKPAGIIPYGRQSTSDLFRAGYAMVAASTDLSLLRAAAASEVRAYREAFG